MNVPRYDDYALVFSGGGALGAWEVGCLRSVLEFHGSLEPSIVTGASAGALNAAGYHCGLSPDALGQFWIETKKEDIFEDSLDFKRIGLAVANSRAGSVMRRFLSGDEDKGIAEDIKKAFSEVSSVFSTKPMVQTLDGILDTEACSDAFSHAKNSLVISTTKLADGKPELLYNLRARKKQLPKTAKMGRYAKAWKNIESIMMLKQGLMATAALPLLFSHMEGRFDGGVLLNQPIAPAVGLGARVIYVFIPTPISFGRTGNLAEIASTLSSTLLATSLEAQIRQIGLANRIYSKTLESPKLPDAAREELSQRIIRLCVVRPENELPTGLLGFGENVPEMIETGYKDANRRLRHFEYEDLEWWDAFMDDDGVLL